MSEENTIQLRRSVQVCADRRLAFQVLTAFGAKTADGSTSEVLSEAGNTKLVKFTTPVKLIWRTRQLATEERVTLDEPRTIDFELLRAENYMRVFSLFKERFTLQDADGCTDFTYDSRFRIHGMPLSYPFAVGVVRPILARFMEQHLAELKQTIEQRAERSKMYPQKKCAIR